MLQVLLVIYLLFQASTSQITGYGDTTAVYGGEAHYGCAVANSTGVQQVTWQRLSKDEAVANLATSSKRFGKEVNQPYRGKVVFTESSLSSTSITLKNITWEDESCYICYFSAFPDGSKGRKTCLTVQGISKVNMSHMINSGSDVDDREVRLSCSATGKPAPTIKWDFSSGATSLYQPQTTTVTNSDQTFTSSSTITLKVPPNWEGHVDCLLNDGLRGQRMERIPLSVRDGKKGEGKGGRHLGVALAMTAIIILIICIVAVLALKQRRSNHRRKNETVA